MEALLKGIRVTELTMWAQGPLAGMILADLGAEVIKLELPITGDPMRGAASWAGRNLLLPSGQSVYWDLFNRNKKSVTVDIHTEAGKQVLYRLAKESDVFLCNLVGGLKSLGADRETILQHNPDIIYAHTSGFGRKGPDSEAPCVDPVGVARSGLMFNTPAPDGSPLYLTNGFADIMSGTMLASGVIAALLARERFGISQSVYASQLQSMMWLQIVNVGAMSNLGYDFLPIDRTNVKNPLLNWYKCGDGQWIVLGMYVTDRFWPRFCEVVGIKELEKDARFQSEVARGENCRELISILDRVFATKPRQEWADAFRKEKFWFSVVNRVADLADDEQVKANDYIVETDTGIKMVGTPFELEKTGVLPLRGAPDLGQHTEEVMTEVLGYNWDEVIALKDQNVI